ncbi:STAS domain-containing protein [Streptomyces sp. NPDC001941]|uniref:STAS domain-containing protein n=1 Tax=Streptomyces sp. NPDC001941 TaxID=3154659 RepID=UPI0033317B12
MPPTPLHRLLRTEPHGDDLLATVYGEIDFCTAPTLAGGLSALAQTTRPRLLIDLRHIDFIDCSGRRALTATRDIVTVRRGRLRLVCTRPLTRTVLHRPPYLRPFDIIPGLPALPAA